MTKIKTDLERLEEELSDPSKFHRNSPLWKVLKRVLSSLGHWKNKPRGNPAKAIEVKKANQKKKELAN